VPAEQPQEYGRACCAEDCDEAQRAQTDDDDIRSHGAAVVSR
jgi:hypothetical protein